MISSEKSQLLRAAIMLTKREECRLVAGTALVFDQIAARTRTTKIEELLVSCRGGVWGDESVEGSGFPVLRSTNMRGVRTDVNNPAWRLIPAGQATRCVLQSGDILVTKSSGSGDLVGKATLFIHPDDGQPYLFSNFLLRLRPNQQVVLAEYLAWFLRSPQALAWRSETQQDGVGLRNLKTSAFLHQRVPVPEFSTQRAVIDYFNALEAGGKSIRRSGLPDWLAQQRRTVAKIGKIANKVDEARTLRERSEDEVSHLLGSYTHHLFSEELHGRVTSIALGDISEIRSGVTLGRQLSGPTVELPYLRVANVQDGYLDLNRVKTVTIRVEEQDKWQLADGDLLLTEGGDWDKLGRGAIWHNEIPDCIHQNHIFRVRLNQGEFDPSYVLALTRSPYGKEYFQNASKKTTNLASINQRQLKGFPVYVLPLKEQRNLVTGLDKLQAEVDRLKALQVQTAAELNTLLPSILDKAFKGEL